MARTRCQIEEWLSVGWRWRAIVGALALLAFLVRLALIAHSHGGSDLRNYTYFARLAFHGHDPYTPPALGAFAPSFANSPPVEFGIFDLLLHIKNSPTTLRCVFALADVATLLLVGLASDRRRTWRLAFMLFFAFDPFVLISWTVFAEDKTIIFFWIALLVIALDADRLYLSWFSITVLTVFKFLGVFAAPVLTVASWRRRQLVALAPIMGFVVISVLSNAFWFPHSLKAFSRRNGRVAIDPPIHASPTMVLSKLGIYATWEVKLLMIVLLLTILIAFLYKRLTIPEATIWSLFAGYVFLPDDSFDRLLLISLPFLLLISLSWIQWVILWIWSCVTALGAEIAVRGAPHALHFATGPLQTVFGRDGTIAHTIWMNSFVALVLGLYAIARHRGRLIAATRPQQHPLPGVPDSRTPKPIVVRTAESGGLDGSRR